MVKKDNPLQKALTEPYSLPYFSQNVLKPVFSGNLTVFASSIPIPVNPSEERMVKWIKKYGEVKLTDYRQVDLYEVALVNNVIVERSKVGIGAVVKKMIFGNNAVLANFYYPDQPNKSWRFSFIAKDQIIEKGETKKVETNPKRYTYILGPNERCRTAAERFNDLSFETDFTIKAFEKAFSVEKLSKKFFDEYKEHYDAFVKHLNKREIKASVFNGDEKTVRDFAKKMLGRIVFLYFVQKKGWLGATNEKWQDGNPNFMEDLFIASGKKETFYPIWLRTLFYDSLNNPDRSHNDFKLPNGTTVKIPYLNGGLFEDDDPKEAAKYLTFPPRLFEDLFEFFNQYNFTIYEDSPDDHTVAVDPEMLGHIFENLLEDNKDKGAYYTPKEIVHYMCQESLIEYLATKLDIPESVMYQELGIDQTSMFGNEAKKGQLSLTKEDKTEPIGITRQDVERFIKYKDVTPQIVKHASDINTHLDTVKICDPAIGSGAFPMGLLHEIFNVKQALKEIRDVKELQSITDAEMKANIIQNSIYGVDIEKGAVDIARLRFWLSLIVDEELPRPLPNLDFKIVVGDSLLSKFEGEVIDIEWGVVLDKTDRSTVSNKQLIDKLKNDLHKLVEYQKKYFSADEKHKSVLRQEIRDLKINILLNQLQIDKLKYSQVNVTSEDMFGGTKKTKDRELTVKLKLADFDNAIKKLERLKKHPNKPLQFFDWKLDFPEILNPTINTSEVGFDIVLGNPPYVNAKMMQKENPYYRAALKNVYHLLTDKWDLYLAFIEKTLNISCRSSIITMIIPNAFVKENYSKKMREYFINNRIVKSVVFYEYDIFEAAVKNIVLTIQKPRAYEIKQLIYHDQTTYSSKTIKIEHIFNSTESNLVRLLDSELTLGDVCFISVGMVLNANESSVKGQFVKDDLVSDTKDKIHCKRYTEGKWIDRYQIRRIKYLEWNTGRVPSKIRRRTFPELYEKNKIMINKLGNIKATLDDSKIFCDQTIRILVKYIDLKDIKNKSINSSIKKFSHKDRQELESISEGFDLKYLLALLNSNLLNYLLNLLRTKESIDLNPLILRKLPIPNITLESQKQIEKFVDEILNIKENNLNKTTVQLERQVDVIVYHLYNLTYEEAKVIDPALNEEEFEKYKI